jgi:malate dehydrogenase (oxaloacetate-decarboxylating)(NADP+)
VLTGDMVKTMADRPVILALANPEPEIRPEAAKAARPDCIVATGRSDYPNQVNNVLCFPYIFRGALDCGATRITEEMKLACVSAIAALAEAEANDAVAAAYAGQILRFGPDYIIPKPFDPRLIAAIAPAVAAAAASSGVATRPIDDMDAYRERLAAMTYHTSFFMRPVFAQARARNSPAMRRVAYAEGAEARVLRAVQTVVDEGLAQPVLIGRGAEIEVAVRDAGLRMRRDADYTVVECDGDGTACGTGLLASGEVDALICGMQGSYDRHLAHVQRDIGLAPGAELAAIARMAAAALRQFGLEPKVALLSHSIFGSSARPSAQRVREARELLAGSDPDLSVIGELHGDAALDEDIRKVYLADGQDSFEGSANLLVMPTLDAANILFNVLKVTSGKGVTVGPILPGAAKPVHILSPSATVRRIVNMSALAVADVKEA